MSTRDEVKNTVVKILAEVTEKDPQEISENLAASLKDDYKMTSMEYFPLISGLEEELNIEIDYSAFLLKAITVNDCIDFINEIVK